MDRRRFLLTSLAGALAAPLAAEAQAGKVARIGFLGSTSPSGYASQMEAFRGGLRDLGYVEGQNLVIEFRWAQGKIERLPELAAELVRLKPDVLVTHGPPGALAAKRATDTDRLSDQWLQGHVGAPEFRFALADSAVDLESVTSAALPLPCPTPLLEGDGAMVDDAPPGHARPLGVGKARQ